MPTLRIAIPKSGRLAQGSLDLLSKCGIDTTSNANGLIIRDDDRGIEIFLVRENDILKMIRLGGCNIAITSQDSLLNEWCDGGKELLTVEPLSFAKRSLLIAAPQASEYKDVQDMAGKRIATSYPKILEQFLDAKGIKANIVTMSGSPEKAVQLGVCDLICIIGRASETLTRKGLKIICEVQQSEAVLIGARPLDQEMQSVYDALFSLLNMTSPLTSPLTSPVLSAVRVNIPIGSMETMSIVDASNDDCLRIAIQESGKLTKGSLELLAKFGVNPDMRIEIIPFRDDDIPEFLMNGTCDIGILGKDVLDEYRPDKYCQSSAAVALSLISGLSFAQCRLSLAIPQDSQYKDIRDIAGKKIATSYPNILKKFLEEQGIEATIVTMSGSVEVAPKSGIADLICDLVDTGTTLKKNRLREFIKIADIEAVLVGTNRVLSDRKQKIYGELVSRINGLLEAGSQLTWSYGGRLTPAIPSLINAFDKQEPETIKRLKIENRM